MDGTLADSLSVMRRVVDEFLAAFGRRGSDAGFERVNGVPLREVVRRLREEHGLEPDERELLSRLVGGIGRAYEGVPPKPGARELLERAAERGMPVALVTSASEAFARDWLARAGLTARVAHVIGGDSVARAKPDPEPYRRALELTGAEAAASVAVEDSRTGARSAVAAGVRTWVLASPATGDRAGWPAVEGFVATLDQVPLESMSLGPLEPGPDSIRPPAGSRASGRPRDPR
jgi:HAD superfamily hydrolase (TIGR01509 family)